jgi:hypothetical protein
MIGSRPCCELQFRQNSPELENYSPHRHWFVERDLSLEQIGIVAGLLAPGKARPFADYWNRRLD